MGLSTSYCCKERDDRLLGYQSVRASRPDHRRFELARAQNDIGSLIHLLRSTEALPKSNRVTHHPWAKAPETVGPLVAAHLAVIVSSSKTVHETDFMVETMVKELVSLARSPGLDRLHAGVVSLGFLTEKSKVAAIQLANAEFEPDIQRCLMSGSVGLELTAVALLRNICKYSREYCVKPIIGIAVNVLHDIIASSLALRNAQSSDNILECLQILVDLSEEPEGPLHSKVTSGDFPVR